MLPLPWCCPLPRPSAAPPTVIGSVIDKMAQLENSNDAMCALLGWVWGVCSIYSIYNISTIYLQSLEYLLWGVEVKQQAAATLLECPAWVEDDGDPHLFLFLFYDRGKDTGWAGPGTCLLHIQYQVMTVTWGTSGRIPGPLWGNDSIVATTDRLLTNHAARNCLN